MINGTVKFFNAERGFGYISQTGDASDIRVLNSALTLAHINTLSEGQKVRFDTHTDPESGKITVHHIEAD